MIDRVMTMRQTWEVLGISRRTLFNLIAKGELPPRIQLSDRRFGYRESDIVKFIEERRETG